MHTITARIISSFVALIKWHNLNLNLQIAKETAAKFANFADNQEHVPLEKSMIAMAIKSILVAGMGRLFMDEKEISKMTTAYEDVSES